MTGSAKPITFLKCRRRSDGFHFVQPILRAECAPLPANCDSRNSVPVVAQRGQLRGPVIAAIAKKVIAARRTAERPRLAMFYAEVEPQTIRLGRMCTLAGGGRPDIFSA